MLRLRAEGFEELAAWLADRKQRFRDVTPAMRQAANVIRRVVDEAYASKRSPDGTPWAPLAASTRARNDAELGEESGRTRADVQIEAGPKGLVITAGGAAYWQQYGTRRMPARPFLPFTRDGWMSGGTAQRAIEEIREALAEYLGGD